MPIRPVSFLAQAAAQRQQTRENEKQREFQKEQALRDFGMNIGQSIVASLGNFGAQAGADAIRFNREEPYKKLEAGMNPVAGSELVQEKTGGQSGLSSALGALGKAALAKVGGPLQLQSSSGPEAQPAPAIPVGRAQESGRGRRGIEALAPDNGAFAKTALPLMASTVNRVMASSAPAAKLVDDVRRAPPAPLTPPSVLDEAFDAAGVHRPAPRAAPRPAPRAAVPPRRESPPPAPPQSVRAPSVANEAREGGYEEPVTSASPRPEAQPTIPPLSAPQPSEVSSSMSSRGPMNPEVVLEAQQQIKDIAQRYVSGAPLKFRKRDGSPLSDEEQSFAEAFQRKRDMDTIEMLRRQGMIEAETANAISTRIKMQGEADAAKTKAEAYEREKAALAWKNMGGAAKSVTQNYAKGGQLLSGAPREFVVTNDPNAPMWPSVESIPDPEAPRRGGGGGARKQSAMFPDATEVWAQGYSETKNDRGQNLQEAVVLPEEYLALADPKLGKFRYITRADAPAIKAALDAKDWQTAQALFKEANAKYAKGYAAQTEAVTPPTVLANAADAAEKAKRAEEARALAAKTKAALDATRTREDAVKEADAARNLARNAPKAAELFPGLDDEDAAEAFAALKSGGRRPAGMRGPEWQAASDQWNKWLEARSVYLNRIDKARGKFKGAGGTDEDFDSLVPPPGPSQQSPGQFPPPGDESKVDELFQMIESQPWSAERKRRVFLTRAREAGLA